MKHLPADKFNGLSADQASHLDYLLSARAKYIGRYHTAKLWIERKDARSWAIFYGRLCRMARRAA